jgi:RND family efflux transporter MFP subunit
VSAEQSRARSGRGRRVLRALLQGALPIAVLAGAGAGVYALMASEPSTERTQQRREPARLVETIQVSRGDHTAVVQAWGEVVPADEVALAPRVGGEIVTVADALEPGGRIRKGQVVARIDQSDYEVALRQARTELAKAKAALRIERGNQKVAETEAELLDQELSAQERDLVLRQPQLRQAKADVEAARAAVEDAQLDLERTTMRAPFDAVVQSVSVDVGSQVSAGTTIAQLIATDRYFVELAVPAAKLRRIEPRAGAPGSGSQVELANPSVWGAGRTRTGEVVRVRPDLSEQGRMARVLVEVTDPLDRDPPMLVGSYLRGRIQGGRLDQVVALDRAHLREDDSVWVMTAADRLEIRAVEIAYRGPRRVYVSVGLSGGERVVTSEIATPTDGMKLRTRDDDGPDDATTGGGAV